MADEVLVNEKQQSSAVYAAPAAQIIRTSQITWGVFWGMTLWSIVAGFVFFIIIEVWLGWSWLYYLLKGRW